MSHRAASVKLLFQSTGEKETRFDFNLARVVLLNLSILFFILLVLTSFLPVLLGFNLTGLVLILHITFAPFFVIAFTLTVMLWAEKMKFETAAIKSNGFNFRLYFWLFLFFSIPAILSVILGMYPLFGMESQQILVEVHKYSVLLLFIILSLFIIKKHKVTDTPTEEK